MSKLCVHIFKNYFPLYFFFLPMNPCFQSLVLDVLGISFILKASVALKPQLPHL